MFRFFSLLSFFILDLFARAGGGHGFSGGGFGGGFSSGDSFGGSSFSLPGSSNMVGMETFFYLILLAMFILFFMWGLGFNKQRVIREGVQRGYEDQFSEELSALRSRDKDFSLSSFQKRCETPFKKIQEAWSQQDMSLARPFVSDAINERFSTQLQMNTASGIHNSVKNTRITRSHIVGIESNPHFDTIHLSITAEAVDYITKIETGKVIHGKLYSDTFTEVWSFIRKPSAKTLSRPGLFEGQCPNCSTPLKISDTLECTSCSSLITSGEYDWVLSEITQAHLFDSKVYTPLNIELMQAKDKGFIKQKIEDRASVIFWKLEAAMMFAEKNKVLKFVRNEFLEKHKNEFIPRSLNKHHYLADASVGTVELLSLELDKQGIDKAYIFILASGHYETRHIPGYYPPEYEKSSHKEIVYVLQRNAGLQTSGKFGLSSYRCPSCGAPTQVTQSPNCTYCERPQNDGSLSWVLSEVMPLSQYTHPRDQNAYVQRNKHYSSTNSYKNNEDLIILLIQTMHIDSVPSLDEMKYLKTMAHKQGISNQRLQSLLHKYASTSYSIKLDNLNVEDEKQIETFFIQLIHMCLIDGKIVSQEVKLLRKIAKRLNFSEIRIRTLIKEERQRMYERSKDNLSHQ